MSETTTTKEILKEILKDLEPPLKSFLTELYEANNFVTYDTFEKKAGLNRRQIAAVKSILTKRFTKIPGSTLYADQLFYRNYRGDHRLRPDLWTVVGEILGKQEKERMSNMRVTIASVRRQAIDQQSIVNFEISGITTPGTTIPIAVTVPARSGNTQQAVERACDKLRAQLVALAESAEYLKENLSQWE